jgi:hypothetical protein
MPIVDFGLLPPDAQLWVFAADKPLIEGSASTLLAEVDAFLAQWNAHGHPLRCGREWRDGRFLAIAVDQSTAGASGCSVDGLFRALQRLQPALGASLLPAARVFWRDESGEVRSGDRDEFIRLANTGAIGPTTPVFDTTLVTAGDWRTAFERPAGSSWHHRLMQGVRTAARA